MIKAIIFDLGGVYFSDGNSVTIQKISEQYHFDPKSVSDFFKVGTPIAAQYRRDEISASEFWEDFKKKFNFLGDTQEIAQIWFDSYVPREGTKKIIKNLEEQGFPIYFLSDNVKEKSKHLQETYNFLEDFKAGIFSYDVGKVKSDGIEIFKLAVDLTTEKAEEILYIDDNPHNIEIAKKTGMQTIVFSSPDQLEKQLVKFGIQLRHN